MKQILAFAAVLATLPAAAHNLWIEPATEGGLRAFYGEPEIRVSEQSPGKLDKLSVLRVDTGATKGAKQPWLKAADAFVLPALNAGADAVLEAQASTVGAGATHAQYYARHAAWPMKAAQPAMSLDIVPTADPDLFAVFFKGAPLARGTLKVIAPSLWLQVHDIDERGLVRIHTPWRGLYVLDVEMRESRAGEIAGQRYATVLHRATLSFTKPDGPAFDRPRPAQYLSN